MLSAGVILASVWAIYSIVTAWGMYTIPNNRPGFDSKLKQQKYKG